MTYRPGDYAKPMEEQGFDYCVNFVIDALEGGDAMVVDSGGKTKFGISQKAHPTLNIPELTRAMAVAIYREQYWTPAGCELVPWPFNLIVFDTAVNEGVTQAVKMRLKAYNWAEMLMERVGRYAHLADSPEMTKFFRGWIGRCVTLYNKAKGG